MAAYASCKTIAAPSTRTDDFDLTTAYAVEAELVRLRKESGHKPVGLKVGFANKAVWRALKLDTLVWAHMYDDTVHYAEKSGAALSIAHMCSPKIEPEIVFRLKRPLESDERDAATVLGAVEWIALGFEIIDCVFADWKFQPTDFVASFGLHAALVVGQPVNVASDNIPALVEQLAQFKLRLSKDGALIEEGSGRNSLRSPALCVAELASAITRRPKIQRLAAGDLISTGTLTESKRIAPGEAWSASVDGIDLPALTLRIE